MRFGKQRISLKGSQKLDFVKKLKYDTWRDVTSSAYSSNGGDAHIH